MLILKTHRNSTLLETNISPENGPVAKETPIWKPSFLRGYVYTSLNLIPAYSFSVAKPAPVFRVRKHIQPR